MITIREYKEDDAPITWELFYNTIRKINSRDYSLSQVQAWASDKLDMAVWRKRMSGISPYIAELNGQVVGYADLQDDGLIDHFFCHAEYQGIGVGRALMEHILATGNAKGISRFYSEVSITAKPFYERFGFQVDKEQLVEMRGQKLTNFVMVKLG